MAVGEMVGAFAMSEPSAGSDVASISTRAVKDGDSYLITGNKYWCTFAKEADFMILVARTSKAPPEKRHLGLSMFIFNKKRGEFPEGIAGSAIPKIGYFGMKTYELAFDNFRIPAENMIGEEGRGYGKALSLLSDGRIAIAALAIGIARAALEAAIRYAKEREAYGKPLTELQAISFDLAEMAMQVEVAHQY
eukprot:gene16975-20757_t